MSSPPHHNQPHNYKLLEIKIISAVDLPPVSKTLHAYVVAWLDPDHKLTTRTNHNGHVNPIWNYKLMFPVDDRFLNSGGAAIKFEIYNVAWLRDAPIGTAKLMLNSFLPPLTAQKPAVRHAAIQIRLPTGHLNGTLNVTIRLIDNNNSPLGTDVGSELSVSPTNNFDVHTLEEDEDDVDGDDDKTQVHEENRENKNEELEIKRVKSVRIVSEKGDASPDDTKLKNCPSFSASYISGMHPLPSEVAAGLKKGMYYFSGEEDDDYGSSIFENWSVPGEETKSKDSKSVKSVTWKMEEKLIPMAGKVHGSSIVGSSLTKKSKSSKRRRGRSRSEGGLLSCFGIVEIGFTCGPKFMDKKKKKTKKSVSF